MKIAIQNVVFACPGNTEETYERALAFQHAQFPAPRWPDPAYPQQVHLDLRVLAAPDNNTPDDPHLGAARDLATHLGAINLKTYPAHTVYADPAGHPFCL